MSGGEWRRLVGWAVALTAHRPFHLFFLRRHHPCSSGRSGVRAVGLRAREAPCVRDASPRTVVRHRRPDRFERREVIPALRAIRRQVVVVALLAVLLRRPLRAAPRRRHERLLLTRRFGLLGPRQHARAVALGLARLRDGHVAAGRPAAALAGRVERFGRRLPSHRARVGERRLEGGGVRSEAQAGVCSVVWPLARLVGAERNALVAGDRRL